MRLMVSGQRCAVCVALLLAFVLGLMPGPLSARDFTPNCSSSSGIQKPVEAAIAAASLWDCTKPASNLDQTGNLDHVRHFYRFDLNSGQDSPKFMISRVAKFRSLSIAAIGDGAPVVQNHSFASLKATYFDRQFIVSLPPINPDTRSIVVMVEKPTQRSTLDYMRLTDTPPGVSEADRNALILIALCTGLMLMPMMFDFTFFRVLRRPFILWHAALVVSMALQLVTTSGLYITLFDANLNLVRVMTIGSFSAMVFTGAMFSTSFIEPDKLPERMRRAVQIASGSFMLISVVHMMGIDALGQLPSLAFYFLAVPLMFLFVSMFASALWAGSIAVRYLIVGLGPILLVGAIRVVSFIIPGMPTVDANEIFLFATQIEVLATTLGVASRFLTLKLERDKVRAEKNVMADLVDHDPLTGLLNRRAIESRFADLREQGFNTFAVLDLDKFKAINDDFGHQKGDEVLKACAAALTNETNRDTIAVRLGGEEFILMIRGATPVEQAEALRSAIPLRVARLVPGLDRPVTASMGIIEIPERDFTGMGFNNLYARADRLLYEAKETGRNRSIHERLVSFGGNGSEIRPEVA